MADFSLYELYVNGMMDDLVRARAGKLRQPKDPNEQQALAAQEAFQAALNDKLIGTKQVRLKNFYHTMSTVAVAEHIAAPVDNPYPECGGGHPKLDEIYDAVAKALTVFSSGVRSVPGWGSVASTIATILSIATVELGPKHQSHAACATAIALVPSCLTLKDLSFEAWVGEGQSPTANPSVDVNDDNWWGWKHVDKPILSPKATGTIKVRTSNQEENPTSLCEVKTLTTKLRNWSHNRNLVFQYKVSWDAPMSGCTHCPDYGMVGENYRDTWLFWPGPEGMAERITRYLSNMLQDASDYEKAYPK